MKHILITCIIIFATLPVFAQGTSTGKELYIPVKVYRVADSNDYNNKESDYSYSRSIQSDNIAIFRFRYIRHLVFLDISFVADRLFFVH